MYILGISAYYHDSAACIIYKDKIIAAAQEERFTRIKHDPSFPINAIKYCLKECEISLKEIEYVSYYEDSKKKFSRLIKTYIGTVPFGRKHFIEAMWVWLNKKIFINRIILNRLKKIGPLNSSIKYKTFDHHYSHAAAAFFPSYFEKAAILCMDGVGEWTTTSAWIGEGNSIRPLWEIKFPHSVGLLYSAFTYFCGFKVNSGEYKLMGLAPYGKPKFVSLIKEELIELKNDGSFRLNLKYFSFHHDFKMTNKLFSNLFGVLPREPESDMSQIYMDIAASIQNVVSEIVLNLSQSLRNETKAENLCLSGGVALNCVANGELVKNNIFEDIWIQPASGDAGSSLGAAMATYYQKGYQRRTHLHDRMNNSYLGPSYSSSHIFNILNSSKLKFSKLDPKNKFEKIAEIIDSGNVIGLFNGRMEFGPRALGNRSIIGDPRNEEMQKKMNLKIKFRESFRPFAPAILEEECANYFALKNSSPYMLLVSPLNQKYRNKVENHILEQNQGLKLLEIKRSVYPSITHVDYSARIQTVNEKSNQFFYSIIRAFYERTGCPMVINTSFNVRGEPIVCTVDDALRCFMHTDMDYLIIEDFMLRKKDQLHSSYKIDKNYQEQLD